MRQLKHKNIIGVSPNGDHVRFASIQEAADLLNGDASNIRRGINHGYKIGGWTWHSADDTIECVPLTDEIASTFAASGSKEKPRVYGHGREQCVVYGGKVFPKKDWNRYAHEIKRNIEDRILDQEEEGVEYSYGYCGEDGPTFCPICGMYISHTVRIGGALVENYDKNHIRECLEGKEYRMFHGGVIRVKKEKSTNNI